MIWEREFVKLVKNEFQKKKLKNPRFSVRQYAKKLDLSIGALSEILNGKRSLTRARALKVVSHLGVEPAEMERLQMLMGQEVYDGAVNPTESEPLPHLQEILLDWRNFVILSALFHQDQKALLPKIAEFTQMSEEDVLNRLEALKAKISTENDYLNFNLDAFKHNSQIFRDDSLKTFQKGQVAMIQRGLEKNDPSDMMFCNLTIATTEEGYTKIRHEIRDLFIRLLSTEQQTSTEKVVQVSMEIFPL